jgi:hypothetical protein
MDIPDSPKQSNYSGEVINKLLTHPEFTLLTRDDQKRKIAFGIIRRGDPDLDRNQVLKERFLKILNSDISVSENLGTPLDIFVARLAVSDIVRTVLMAALVGTDQKYSSYFIPFVTDREAGNRARNIEILLDFAEAVMLGNDQVDTYLTTYLAKNPTPPQTFSEWQKSLSSAPIGSPQTIIPSARETLLNPEELEKFLDAVEEWRIKNQPGGVVTLSDAMNMAKINDLEKFLNLIVENGFTVGKVGEDKNLSNNVRLMKLQITKDTKGISNYELRN